VAWAAASSDLVCMMSRHFFFFFFLLLSLGAARELSNDSAHRDVWYLLPNGSTNVDNAFLSVFQHFEDTFDHRLYKQFVKQGADAYANYASYPRGAHCDKGKRPGALRSPGAVGSFPGGSVKRVFGFDFGKEIYDITKKATGAGGASAGPPMALASQGLSTGMGMVQSILAAVLDVVPPLIPPPAWNNMPLPCAPMLTGHICFGAVLYPITMADFTIADVTDGMLSGYVSGFPNTYAEKVGKTSDKMYKACFSAYMSMHCSAIFPRCTVPQSRSEPIPAGGRVPMCLHLCILPLVLCPGFWIGDVIGQCEMVAPPPMCTQAFFWNYGLLPPQYVSYDEGNPYPKKCPKEDDSDDSGLLDEGVLPISPILKEASVKLPALSV